MSNWVVLEQQLAQWQRPVASSKHGPPSSGDAFGILPAHCNGHRNGQQRGDILHGCFVDCRPGGRWGDTE